MPPRKKAKAKKIIPDTNSAMGVDDPGWIRKNIIPILGTIGGIGASAVALQQLHEHGYLALDPLVNAVDLLSPATGHGDTLKYWGRAVRDAVTGDLVQ